MNILRALGCVGVVTNGSVRDLPAAENAGFHFFAGSVSVSHAYVHIVEVGQAGRDRRAERFNPAICCTAICTASNPSRLESRPRFRPRRRRSTPREQALIALCQSPEFSLEKLRAAVAKENV